MTTAADASIPIVPRQAMKHYWSATLNDLKSNSKDAYDIMWVLSGKPKYGCMFDIMKDAKYKYKLAVRELYVVMKTTLVMIYYNTLVLKI